MWLHSGGDVWLTRGEVWISESVRLVFLFLSSVKENIKLYITFMILNFHNI